MEKLAVRRQTAKADRGAHVKKLVIWAPLALFLAFLAIIAFGLVKPGDRTVRSALVGKPLPTFNLPAATVGVPGLKTADFASGQPRLLNIFASWCVPCAAETPVLLQLKAQGVKIDAIAIRDRPEDVTRFLGRYGNPYHQIGSDQKSVVQLAMGSSGVPESFVIDGKGVIRYQHVGDIRTEDMPLILEQLEAAR